jgi:hypothetical protein
MKWCTLAFLALVLASGCSKKAKTEPANNTGGGGPNIVNQGGNLTVRGGEGAIQAPRMAAARTANEVELRDLHLGIFQAMQADPNETPPDLNEVKEIVRQNAKLAAHVKEEIVILTGSQQKDGVFAYTQWPQRMDQHYVVTKQGVEMMPAAELKKRLEAQKSPVKLSK